MTDQIDILSGEVRSYRLPAVGERCRRYQITPVPKPRMTQRDRWARRPAVIRYREFCDQVRAHGIEVRPSGDRVIFILPMPQSWSRKKRAAMLGQPHQSKPDTDNLLKALLDAIYSDDQHIYHADALKFWGEAGEVIIERTGCVAAEFDGDRVVWEGSL